MNKNTFLKYIFLVIIVSLFLEIFVFNYNFFFSLFYDSQKISYIKKNTGLVYNEVLEQNYYNYEYEIANINKTVHNIYLDISNTMHADVDIFLSDDANYLYYKAGKQHISTKIEQSKYLKVHPSGKTQNIKLKILADGNNFNLKNIYINQKVPFYFNILRFFICLIVILSIILLTKFHVFSLHFCEFKYKYFLVFLLFFIFSGIYVFLNFSNRANIDFKKTGITQHNQYQLLAQSLAKGKVSLDLKVTDELLTLKNPYDQAYRDKKLETNVDYYLDYAFYDGKYYSYFGVVPCLLMHLPYYVITGNDLNNVIAMLISCIFYVLASFYLVYQIFLKYFSKASFKMYLFFSLLLSLCSGLSCVIRIGYFYGIPIAMGAAFAMVGISFWLKSTLKENINKKYLLLGSICMAVVAGCRPQLLVSSFLIFPIFWKNIKNKQIFKFKNVLCIAIPYLIVASLLMVYNYIRFDSVFDFGATYNLTSNDMTKRGFVLGRIGLGLYSFLFEIPHVNTVFPFINSYQITSSYLGVTIYETMAGGFFALNLLGIINLFIFKLKKYFVSRNAFYLCVLSLVFALIIVVVDAQVSGILPRYICDFGFLITISSIILCMSLLQNYKGNVKLIEKMFIGFILLAILYNFLYYFTDFVINGNYRTIFYYFYYTFMFWL